MTETAWRGRGSGFWGPEERARGATVNMASIAFVRAWAEKALGVSSVLVMERAGGRTRVALRFMLDCGTGECEVATLDALRKRRLKGPQLAESLRAVIQ